MNVETKWVLRKWRVAYIDPLRRHVESFWSWWCGELIELLPQSFRETITQRNRRLFIEFEGTEIVVRHGTAESAQEIMRVAIDSPEQAHADLPHNLRDAVLLLPRDKVLSKTLTLPLATEENLREVLGFEMDRHTPFSADQVYYDFSITGRAVDRQELSLEFVYSPRKSVHELLALAARYGIHPNVVTCHAAATEHPHAVNLLPAAMRHGERKTVNRLNFALSCLAILLFITALSLPLLQKQRLIRLLEPQIQHEQAAAGEANRLLEEVEKLAQGSKMLMQKKQSNLLIVQVINEISRILPDHTWINRLDINGEEIQLQGQSSSAAALIGLIESSPVLHNARFRSPVVQVPQTEAERFHLSADVVWAQTE